MMCVNTDGSYNCVCKDGFAVINGTCKGKFLVF